LEHRSLPALGIFGVEAFSKAQYHNIDGAALPAACLGLAMLLFLYEALYTGRSDLDRGRIVLDDKTP